MKTNRNYLLAAFIIFLFSGFLLTSCYSVRKCQKHCSYCLTDSSTKETDSITMSIDTTKNETLGIDTLKIYVNTPGPIQWLQHPCASLCDSLGHLKPMHKEEHKNGMTSTIDSQGDSLKFGCKEDSMLIIQKTLERELKITKTISEKKTKETIMKLLGKQKSGWQIWWEQTYKYSAWFLYFCIIAILLFLFAYWYLHRGLPFRK